jgi:hypothetical protein
MLTMLPVLPWTVSSWRNGGLTGGLLLLLLQQGARAFGACLQRPASANDLSYKFASELYSAVFEFGIQS